LPTSANSDALVNSPSAFVHWKTPCAADPRVDDALGNASWSKCVIFHAE
jgi:hypothetical protein